MLGPALLQPARRTASAMSLLRPFAAPLGAFLGALVAMLLLLAGGAAVE